MNKLETDLMQHQTAVDKETWHDCAVTTCADALARRWYREYLIDGYIEFLDWDCTDITIMVFKSKAVSQFQVISDEAFRVVQADPEKWLPEPDYLALEWD